MPLKNKNTPTASTNHFKMPPSLKRTPAGVFAQNATCLDARPRQVCHRFNPVYGHRRAISHQDSGFRLRPRRILRALCRSSTVHQHVRPWGSVSDRTSHAYRAHNRMNTGLVWPLAEGQSATLPLSSSDDLHLACLAAMAWRNLKPAGWPFRRGITTWFKGRPNQ